MASFVRVCAYVNMLTFRGAPFCVQLRIADKIEAQPLEADAIEICLLTKVKADSNGCAVDSLKKVLSHVAVNPVVV